MSLQQSVMQALIVLGSSADEVADRLAALGFKGQRGVNGDCPVARYLRESLHTRRISIGCFFVYVGGFEFFLPDAVRDFIRRFDVEGKYPLPRGRRAGPRPGVPQPAGYLYL